MTAAYYMITTSIAMEDNSSFLKNSTISNPNSSDGQNFENKTHTYLVYVTIFTSVLAIILNCLSMMATLHVPGKLTSHLKYIVSLSLSDMLLPLASISSTIHVAILPYISNNWENLHSNCAQMIITVMINISILAIQLILVAMAFDHYIAINKPLQYINICSKGKANVVILLVWSVASIICLTDVIIGIKDFYGKKTHNFRNFCQSANMMDFTVEYIIYGTTIVSLIMIMAIYGKIFCNVKDLTTNMQEPRQRNWLRNKKALATTLLIVGSFFLFYLPNCFYQIKLLIKLKIDPSSLSEKFDTIYEISSWLYLMQIMNSVCDPIIYALRLKEVQCGYNIMRRKLQCLIVCSQHRYYRYSYQSTTSSRSRTGSAISEDKEQNHRFSLTNSQCITMESSNTRNTTGKETMLCNHGDLELGVTDVLSDAV